jgi:hypothetical protein
VSFSFDIQATTKTAAKEAVAAEFDQVALAQPIYERAREAVLANANAVIALLPDDASKDIAVSCSGTLLLSSGSQVPAVTGASVACTAGFIARE